MNLIRRSFRLASVLTGCIITRWIVQKGDSSIVFPEVLSSSPEGILMSLSETLILQAGFLEFNLTYGDKGRQQTWGG